MQQISMRMNAKVIAFLVPCLWWGCKNATDTSVPPISKTADVKRPAGKAAGLKLQPAFLGHWSNESTLQRLVLQEDGLCYVEDFMPATDENQPARRCYGVWKQLEVQIELAVYCEPDSKAAQVPVRFTYHAQKDELTDEEGNVFVHDPTADEPVDLPPPRDIVDYFTLLPAHYLTFGSSYHENDYFNGHKNFLSVIDRRNGYLADERRRLEAALFLRSDGQRLLLVSNRIVTGPRSTKFDTYFLTYEHGTRTWTEVSKEVLPKLPAALFFSDPETIKLMEESTDNNIEYTYRFEPSRRGTDLRVSLEINRRRSEEPATVGANRRPVILRWDREAGRFAK